MRVSIISVVLILCIVYSVSASDTVTKDALERQKLSYELQEHCGETCEHWSKQHAEVIDYRAHYNAHLNKCFVLATLSPIKTDESWTSYEMIHVVNENTTYGHLTTRSYNTSNNVTYQCMIMNKAEKMHYEGEEAKDKWAIFVKEMMED
jgi:hypothetical protein